MQLDVLYDSILKQNVDGALKAARECLSIGIDPLKALERASEAIRKIGDLYERAEVFLPEVVLSADAMKKVSEILLEKVPQEKRGKTAKFVIGTVEGDIHDIGKGIVATMLDASGFEIIDLGRDVATEKFVEAVKKHKPELIGCSALMTTTTPVQGEIIEALKSEKLRSEVKVMIGGGATTQVHADEIGADGWGADAIDAVAKAKKLLAF